MTAVSDELVLLVMGAGGDCEGGLEDPGERGFAFEELYPGSLVIEEQADGTLWLGGDARAFRGELPPGAQGHVRVHPRGAMGWLAIALQGA